jgi:hypothetical protein
MTKPSTILICPVVPLRTLPPQEQDVLRRFFCEHVRGMDPANDRRWRRFVGQLWRAEPGEGFQIDRREERGGPFHRRHRAILNRLFDAQERYTDVDVMHDWIKLKCWFVTWEEGRTGKPIPKPRSTNFADCPEDDMRELHTKAVALLHEPWVQRRFWPHLNAIQRQEMLDAILADPKEHAA